MRGGLSIAGYIFFTVLVGLADLFVAPELMNDHGMGGRLVGFGIGGLFIVFLALTLYRIYRTIRAKVFFRDF